MSLLDRAAEWLADRLADNVSHSLAYTQGATTLPLAGTRAVELVRVLTSSGSTITARQASFVIRAADVTVTPQRGDTIAETIGTDVVRWEVMPDPNGVVWQYEDAGESMIRVFVQESVR